MKERLVLPLWVKMGRWRSSDIWVRWVTVESVCRSNNVRYLLAEFSQFFANLLADSVGEGSLKSLDLCVELFHLFGMRC